MSERIRRIGLILLMLAVCVYTVINYMNEKISLSYLVIFLVFLAPLTLGQIAALIRDWKD